MQCYPSHTHIHTQGINSPAEKKAFVEFIHDKVEGASDTGVVVEMKRDAKCLKCAATIAAGEVRD
jgi:hypothetical protein